jgi:hypothetical protein
MIPNSVPSLNGVLRSSGDLTIAHSGVILQNNVTLKYEETLSLIYCSRKIFSDYHYPNFLLSVGDFVISSEEDSLTLSNLLLVCLGKLTIICSSLTLFDAEIYSVDMDLFFDNPKEKVLQFVGDSKISGLNILSGEIDFNAE